MTVDEALEMMVAMVGSLDVRTVLFVAVVKDGTVATVRGGDPILDEGEGEDGYQNIGECLLDARASLGLSRRAVAQRCGTSTKSIWNVENNKGARGPTTATVEDIAAALDVVLRFDGSRWDWEPGRG
jgi:DNA-binding XRE family transcriptional regulator